MFPHLPPFAGPSRRMTEALLDIGRAGGIMDAKDDLSKGPKLLITDLSLSAGNPNALLPNGKVGTTFMGQFMDHDMTFDTTSRMGQPTVPGRSPNARTPAFDLDSVYGFGPTGSPQLYEPSDRMLLRVESGGLFEDLPRTADRAAIIGDPRNDEHVILAGLHCAFLKFHNNAVRLLRSDSQVPRDEVFTRAQRLTRWHYQWIVLHEILPSFIGAGLVDEILARPRQVSRRDDSDDADPIPVEFQAAAYRFGHSLVRPSYRANLAGDNGQPFFGLIFDPAGEGQADPVDLRGGARAPRRFVGWQTFFDFGDGEVKPRKRIDTLLSSPLFNLPLGAIASGDPPTSLAQRNLLRQLTWSLPSGQRVAQAMGAPVLSANDFPELSPYRLGLERSTPLWYYILKEALVFENGQHLGPVGGGIVGEVIIGELRANSASFLSAEPDWEPTLPSSSGTGRFTMVDFLTFAGVDPVSRGQ